MAQEERKVQWTPIIELAITMIAILGTVIPLYVHSDLKMESIRQQIATQMETHRQELTSNRQEFAAKIEANRQDSLRIQEEIKEDMKDFHRQLIEIERSRYKEKQS